jgi:hypothetical protein
MAMIFENILVFGLATIPFFVWSGMDTREPKYVLAAGICLVLGLLGIRSGLRYRNIWLLAFLAFLPVNYILSPGVDIMVSGIKMPSWILQASWYVMCFFLAHAAISNANLNIPKILQTATWVGTVMAGYMLLQYFHFEQFFYGTPGAMCGTMGSTALSSAFVAMLVPLALYQRARWQAGLMIVAVLLVNSQIAYGALTVALLFLWGSQSRKCGVYVTIAGIVIGGSLVLGYFFVPWTHHFIGGGDRLLVWRQAVVDIHTPLTPGKAPYSITGLGLGSFHYLFHAQHPLAGYGEKFLEAHNDYVELLYNTGIVGLGLFLAAFWTFLRACFPLNRLRTHLFASFLCIAICAGGLFVWQNGAIIFYTLIITGLLTGRTNDTSSNLN